MFSLRRNRSMASNALLDHVHPAPSAPRGPERFVPARQDTSAPALVEIGAGRKRSHRMWIVFPSLESPGSS
jgi:hypothetical protein